MHFNQIPNELRTLVKSMVGTSESDLYYAFIVKSISLLKEGGELIYIVPYHFFYNTYAKTIREVLLRNGKIETIIDLDETHLFSNENPEIIIFKFIKGEFNLKEEKINLLNIKSRKTNPGDIYTMSINALKMKISNELFEYQEIPHYVDYQHWSSFYLDIPYFPSIKLKNIAKIGVGLVSGFDEAFILNNEEIFNLNNNEAKIIKKFVKAKGCNRFIVNDYTNYVLINEDIKSEEELKSLYPNIYEKISKYKVKMSKRYLPNRKQWFHWQALRNYKFLISTINKNKIFVPTLG